MLPLARAEEGEAEGEAEEEWFGRKGEGDEEEVGTDVVVDCASPSRMVRRPVMAAVLRGWVLRGVVLRVCMCWKR